MATHLLGRGWSFPVHFDPRTKELVMVADLDDVQESLRILLATHPGDRAMEPTYGCGIRRYIFEDLNAQTLAELKEVITQAILFFEPRIQLLGIDAELEEKLEDGLRLTLRYSIQATRSEHVQVIPNLLRQAASAPEA